MLLICVHISEEIVSMHGARIFTRGAQARRDGVPGSPGVVGEALDDARLRGDAKLRGRSPCRRSCR